MEDKDSRSHGHNSADGWRYQRIAELLADYAYELQITTEHQFKLAWASAAFLQSTGYSRGELIRRNDWLGLFHSDDRTQLQAHLATALAGERSVAELRLVRPDDRDCWLRDHLLPIWDVDQQRVTALLGAAQDITAARARHEDLRRQQEAASAILHSAGDAIIVVDEAQQIILFNQGAEAIFGYASHEMLGRPLEVLLPERFRVDHRRHLQAFAAMPPAGRPMGLRRELFGLRRNGSEFPLEASIAQIRIDQQRQLAVVLHDVTAYKQTEAALYEANRQLTVSVAELERRTSELATLTRMGESLQSSASVGEAYAIIARFARQLFPGESGVISMWRPDASQLEAVVGWGERFMPVSSFPTDQCWAIRRGRIHLVDATSAEMPCAHAIIAEQDAMLCVPLIAQGEALGVLHLHFGGQPDAQRVTVPAATRQLAVAIAEQIALALSNLKLRETLRSQAVRDSLTGLFNRRYMEESLERELHRASRNRYPIGVIMIDIDHFKRFNDLHGHEAGDTMLRAVGSFLQAAIRAEDIACRYGGEEFALIMPQAALEVTVARAEHIRTAIKNLQVVYLNHALGPISISAGVSCIPSYGTSVQSAIRQADLALYRAKNEGRDRVILAHLDQEP